MVHSWGQSKRCYEILKMLNGMEYYYIVCNEVYGISVVYKYIRWMDSVDVCNKIDISHFEYIIFLRMEKVYSFRISISPVWATVIALQIIVYYMVSYAERFTCPLLMI